MQSVRRTATRPFFTSKQTAKENYAHRSETPSLSPDYRKQNTALHHQSLVSQLDSQQESGEGHSLQFISSPIRETDPRQLNADLFAASYASKARKSLKKTKNNAAKSSKKGSAPFRLILFAFPLEKSLPYCFLFHLSRGFDPSLWAGKGKLIKQNLHRITKATRKNGIQYWRNLGTSSSRGIYKRMNGFPCQLLFNDLCSPPPHALCKRACVTHTQRSARRELCTAPRSVF